MSTIHFVPVRFAPDEHGTGWAEGSNETILRRCPVCEQDSIVGHGRRCKQAHDEYHDWIQIRRGRCSNCGTTFSFLPVLSLPYTHYSLLARVQALRRRFEKHCSWEQATPTLQDSNRVPDPSTLRRWSHDLDSSQSALSFLRQTVARLVDWLRCGDEAAHGARFLSWLTPVLQVRWPLRL